jgi:hypothetical protein
MDDALAAEFAMARTTLVTTYDGDGRPIGQGRATAFFFDACDLQFAVTNAHVLEEYCARRTRGEQVALQLAVEHGRPGAEGYAGYLLMPQQREVSGGVTCAYAFKDIGLIELTAETAKRVREHKEFFRAVDVSLAEVRPKDELFYRGYPKGDVEFHGPIRSVRADGYTHFTQVTRVTEKFLAIDRREDRIVFGGGSPSPERDLHGISGSALVDRDGKLRGVIWGGDDYETWAVPVAYIVEAVELYRARR